MTILLAVDLGAESGRVIQGEFFGDRLELSEVARFPTGMTPMDGHLRWDLDRILESIDTALGSACAKGGVAGIGVDTWGVDFGLLDESEQLIEPPIAYRDPRTDGVMERFFESVPRSEIYERTGIQFLPFNTLYQLAAAAGSPSMKGARHLLLMADLVHHHLTGERTTEFTNATTTQCFDPRRRRWDHTLLEAAGVSLSMMQAVVEPGTILGAASRFENVPIIAPATHDTASAVAAAPAQGGDWAYISSGTWSLLGIETNAPITTAAAMEGNFTNEGGIAGTNRFLKNIMGLWIVQRLRADLAPELDYETLAERASSAPPFAGLIDPDDPRFLNPDSMADAVARSCAESGRPPDATGAFVRCAMESLALRYRAVLAELEEVTGRKLSTIHVVGGGARNRLLNQMTADATGCPVFAGPFEATAVGNLLCQAIGLGLVESHEEGRMLVRRSFPVELFEPGESGPWNEAWERFPGRRSE